MQRTQRQASNCFAYINEANIDHPGNGKKQFIEILQICNEPLGRVVKPNLHGYELAILQGYPVQLVFVLDLYEFPLKDIEGMRYAFVIGGEDVPLSWKTDIGDNRAQSTYSDSKWPVGDEFPFGILLMYSKDRRNIQHISLNKRNRDGNYLPRKIDFDLNILRSYTQDMLVYGRSVHTHRCRIFEQIMENVNVIREHSLMTSS